MRQKIIAANWKMNILPSEAKALIVDCLRNFNSKEQTIIICPPFTHLAALSDIAPFTLGAQNCHEMASGAFTGEISCAMLLDLNCHYVILGHSERRTYEISENKRIPGKIKTAIHSGLNVIYCCGEPLDVRKSNHQNDFVLHQLQHDLSNLDLEEMKHICIAYEPIWAIGTGQTASAEQAEEMHKFIRYQLNEMFDAGIAEKCSILYGGSVKSSNANDLAAMPDIDGVLVGGASLVANEFMAIANAF